MFFSVPMVFFFFHLGYCCRGALAKVEGKSYPCLVALAMLFAANEIFFAMSRHTPNMAIPDFPSPLSFLVAAICGIVAILFFSSRSFAAIQFVGRYSLYYFLMERWNREFWFWLSTCLMPRFFARPAIDNLNLMSLTAAKVAVTLIASLLLSTACLPLLHCTVSWML